MKKCRALIALVCAAALVLLAALLVRAPSQSGGQDAPSQTAGECGAPVSAENAENFGALLCDLVAAYEEPSEEASRRIDADLETIAAVNGGDLDMARAIAEHWRKVYLDPDYELFMYHGEEKTDALRALGIPDDGTHAVVILGYELMNGGMQPELIGRCDAAAALARAYPKAIVVCTGGATGPNNPEGHTEAGLMKEYLTESCGLAASRIYTDESAMTTAENARNTFELLRANNVRSVTIVTSSYHQRWGQTLYNVMAELYRQRYGFEVEIVGNYCYETEPSSPLFSLDDRLAVMQIGRLLELPEDVMRTLPPLSRNEEPGAGRG